MVRDLVARFVERDLMPLEPAVLKRESEGQRYGLTLVPTRMYFAGPRSRAKVELALAKGKDLYDKRQTIRRREMAREVQRELREAGR